MPEKFALVSVSDKTGVEHLARALAAHGYGVLSTGGTATYLRERGVVVTDVSEVTEFPEIMDGRVKTLHPMIHGGILARRDKAAHREVLESFDIPRIDVVVVNLYPFSRVVARTETTKEEALENIDIGGPCMVRAAAKNHPWVTVVVDPNDYQRVIEELNEGGVKQQTRLELARKAFAHTARYDSAISDYLSVDLDRPTPDRLDIVLEKVMGLRYGENPHQNAALYRADDGVPLGGFVQLHGKELSYNNLVDLDAAVGLIREFDEPAATVVKHTNPAGCAVASDVGEAFEHALACDPKSAFGGIIALNRPATVRVAEIIADSFFEVVTAPGFEPEALDLLTKKRNLRLLTMPAAPSERALVFRQTTLGWLAQDIDKRIRLDPARLDNPTKRAPTAEERRDLLFAWRVCKHVKSNAIVLARDGATIGVGAGQMSRVDAVDIAIRKAAEHSANAASSVLASDAFFPFRDGPDAAAAAGVTAIIQPGGSVRDEEVIEACDEHGIAMLFTGQRHFRH